MIKLIKVIKFYLVFAIHVFGVIGGRSMSDATGLSAFRPIV